jgi:hypothetical protein
MDNYLPTSSSVHNEFRNGRNVHDGYIRGWGLQFGELQAKISVDSDYQDALTYAHGRSIVSLERMMNIFLLFKFFLPRLPHGDVVEYGCYRGGSAFFMGSLAKKFLPDTNVYALDTFEGMPETDKAIDFHNRGDFNANFEEVLSAKLNYGLDNVHLIRGLFEETTPKLLRTAKRFVLSHIDCDTYSSVKYSYDSCRIHMVDRGYIVFDDSTTSSCIGATEAVEKLVIQRDELLSEQIFPHHVFRALASAPKAVVRFREVVNRAVECWRGV